MAIIKPSTRYTTHKIGSSSDPTKPLGKDNYVIVESADATKYPDQDDRVRVAKQIDIVYDLVETIQAMALSEAFTVVGGATYNSDGILTEALIKWADGVDGPDSKISNVITDDFGISSIRYNRSAGKYITVNITRDVDGNVTATSATATGYQED